MGVDRGMCLWSRFVFLGKGQETPEKVEQAMEEEEEEEGCKSEMETVEPTGVTSSRDGRIKQKLAHPQRVKLEDVSRTGNKREREESAIEDCDLRLQIGWAGPSGVERENGG